VGRIHNQRKSDQAPVSNWQKTTTPLNGKKRCGKKQQQTKTTKHTIEFSNNTPARPRNKPAAKSRVLVVRTIRNPPKWVSLWEPPRSSGQARVAATPISYVRDNSESNGLMGRVFRFRRHGAHASMRRLRQIIQRARCPQYSACRGAGPASGRVGSPPSADATPRFRSARC
jgi:hypothetical protein